MKKTSSRSMQVAYRHKFVTFDEEGNFDTEIKQEGRQRWKERKSRVD